GDAEVHASGSPLFRVAPVGPDRESRLKGGDGPFLICLPLSGEALAVGNTEVHLGGGPLFRIALAGPDRQGILKGRDSQLPALRRVAISALRVIKPKIQASGGPVGVPLGRFVRNKPVAAAFAVFSDLDRYRQN